MDFLKKKTKQLTLCYIKIGIYNYKLDKAWFLKNGQMLQVHVN